MSTQLDLSSFGFADFAPEGSTWRNKDQELFIADGTGVFKHAGRRLQDIAEGWAGAKPGHGLCRVHCKVGHDCDEANGLMCEPGNAEEYPPGELELAELRAKCEKKSLGPGHLARFFEQYEARVIRLSSAPPGSNPISWPVEVKPFTWAIFDKVKHDVFKHRIIPRRPEYRGEHEALEAAEATTYNETLEEQQAEYDANQVDLAIEDAPKVVQGEVMSDLPACVNQDGEITDLAQWMQLAGIHQERFRITDDESAQWLIERIRGLQGQIEEITKQVPLMINARLNAISGLTQYYAPQLRDWGEPKLARHANDSKPGAKNPHKKGELKAKNVRTLSGALFFKKVGGAKNVEVEQTREFCKSLHPKDYEKYGVRKSLTIQLPPGYEVEVYAPDSSEALDTEQYLKHGVSVSRDLSYSKTVMGSRVEAGEKIPGWMVIARDELGQVTIGGERAWSWNSLLDKWKKAIKLLTLKGENTSEEESNDE